MKEKLLLKEKLQLLLSGKRMFVFNAIKVFMNMKVNALIIYLIQELDLFGVLQK